MTMQLVTQNWALVVASVFSLAILLFVLSRLYEASPRGRLSGHVAVLRKHKTEVTRAEKRLAKASKQLSALRSKADSTKPRLLSEAKEAIQDAQSLLKIAGDQVLRAQKLLRDVILEEFPPKRQDVLRRKYL
jgi:Skp family chaperone for outer membrane proteins